APVAGRGAVQPHEAARLEIQAGRRRRLDAIEVDAVVAGEHAEIDGLTEVRRQPREEQPAIRLAGADADGVEGEVDEGGSDRVASRERVLPHKTGTLQQPREPMRRRLGDGNGVAE